MTLGKAMTIALVACAFAVPAAAHHAAEGIISDDVWQRINDQLCGDDPSPHCDLDFDLGAAMDSMMIVDVGGQGADVILTSSIMVSGTEVANEYMSLLTNAVDQLTRSNPRNGGASTSSVPMVTMAPLPDTQGSGDGGSRDWLILLEEPIGSGESQDDLVNGPGRGR